MTVDPWLGWLTTAIGGGLSGGLAVKLIEIFFEHRREIKARRLAEGETVEKSFEPLLKAGDELVGKLRSLGEQDFLPIRDNSLIDLTDRDFAGLVYLFVQFWAEIELNRSGRLSSLIGRSTQGAQAQSFFICLESRRVRLVDRITQRAIGESALVDGRTMNFVEFIRTYETDAFIRRWLDPLIQILRQTKNTTERQRLLQYFAVVHAMIDTLDPAHLVTRSRPAIPNKLSKRSRAELNYRVFGVYLSFVGNRGKYIGPPKRRP